MNEAKNEPKHKAGETRQGPVNDPDFSESPVRRALPDCHWEGVETLRYKDEGSAPFRDVTRQVLFQIPELHCEWRYFEVAPDGHSTLECHEHAHAVMILRGRGRCLIGRTIHRLNERDLVTVPPGTWHQFRADEDSPLGFLCLVNRDRDRPRLPTEQDIEQMNCDPRIAAFIRAGS